MRRYLEQLARHLSPEGVVCLTEAFLIGFVKLLRFLSSISCLCYQGCLCVNPGQLARGTGGGTYAELAVHPIPKATLEKKQDGE